MSNEQPGTRVQTLPAGGVSERWMADVFLVRRAANGFVILPGDEWSEAARITDSQTELMFQLSLWIDPVPGVPVA